jgi:hypothetical protein
MVVPLVHKNVTEAFCDNLNMVARLVLLKNLTDIKIVHAMIMTAVLIAKLVIGINGVTAVQPVERA